MRKTDLKKSNHVLSVKMQSGFTIVEVMLVLAITGLMLIGLIGGSFASIGRQRYNDAVRDFGDYMSGVYSSVIRPSSLGTNGELTTLGNSADYAILGKVLVFGADYDGYTNDDKRSVFSVTLVGSTDILRTSTLPFMQELASEGDKLQLVCGKYELGTEVQRSSVERYMPLWESYLSRPINASGVSENFKGTMIIARTPTSSTVHTAFAEGITYDLKNKCTPENHEASSAFTYDLGESVNGRLEHDFNIEDDTIICIKSSDVGAYRAIQIDGNGSNSAAVKVLSEADSDSGEIRCR